MNLQAFSKNISTSLGIIIIVSIVLLAGGVLAYQYWWAPKLETFSTPPPTPDETADWKTYRNEEFGFEIKYPAEYALETPLGPEQVKIDGISIYVTPELKIYRGEAGGYLLGETARGFPGNILLEDAMVDNVPFQKDYYIGYGGSLIWSSGINAFNKNKHQDNYFVISMEYYGFEATPPKEILKLTDGACYGDCLTDVAKTWLAQRMRYGEREETRIFHKMLSTFKFLK